MKVSEKELSPMQTSDYGRCDTMKQLLDNSPNRAIVDPYQNFSMEDMKAFYTARQFLHYEDANGLLNKCIVKKEEIRHYKDTFKEISGRCYHNWGLLGMVERDYSYERDYTVESKVWVSTQMLMDKLDASLFYWRELNPALVQLLSKVPLVELEVVSNWVKMIHYLSPYNATSGGNA